MQFSRNEDVDSPSAGDRITAKMSESRRFEVQPSKLNSAAQKILRLFAADFVAPGKLMVARPLRTGRSSRRTKIRSIFIGDPHSRAAQPMLKNIGLVVLIQPLAINGRVNPELRASSVVDLECIRRCTTLGAIQRHVLLRKEVIQPHLPIRLPCYDFVPLT
jgi:hypothetical protein